MNREKRLTGWRARGHEIIFEADTKAGKAFDVLLILAILMSVVVVCLDSVREYRTEFGPQFLALEWVFTVLFTIEYILRILCTGNPWGYIRSFYGLIDLFAVLPTYLSLLFPGTQYLVVLRILRVLRIFRVLKLVTYVSESMVLMKAIRASRRKITVFLFAVLTLVVLLGSLVYLIEGEENGFTSIPTSIYWAIVTLTTVGYGDLSPKTGLGQTLAAVAMILGYAIIAVPTGIVTVEMSRAGTVRMTTQVCPNCGVEGHDEDARFCKSCGASLEYGDASVGKQSS